MSDDRKRVWELVMRIVSDEDIGRVHNPPGAEFDDQQQWAFDVGVSMGAHAARLAIRQSLESLVIHGLFYKPRSEMT